MSPMEDVLLSPCWAIIVARTDGGVRLVLSRGAGVYSLHQLSTLGGPPIWLADFTHDGSPASREAALRRAVSHTKALRAQF